MSKETEIIVFGTLFIIASIYIVITELKSINPQSYISCGKTVYKT